MSATKKTPVPKHSEMHLSKITLTQQEMMAGDFDLDKFNLIIEHKLGVKLSGAITDAKVSRTTDGASTLTVTVHDPDKTLLKSGLHDKIDVNVDGLWWRLAQIEKQSFELTLTFEDREIAILRSYRKIISPISRSQLTRTEFVVRMLKEVSEFSIPYFIPELHKKQPIFDQNSVPVFPPQSGKGIAHNDVNLTVKGDPANFTQINTANEVLLAGDAAIPDSNPHKRKIMVCSIMTAIVESSITNLPGGDLDSKGVFQQRRSQGWPASGDVVIDANEFFARAIAYDNMHPSFTYNDLCQGVQHSGTPDAYGLRRTEAERFVAAFGSPGYDAAQAARDSNASAKYEGIAGGYHFYRGIPPSRKNSNWLSEDTWSCIQRLADEVNWRAFFVSGVFYMMSEDDLFKSKPVAVLSEASAGIDWIDGDIDKNKRSSSVTISCRMGRYAISPGTVVKIVDHGPFNGRWLVETIDRDLSDPSGTIEVKKPEPTLLEPFKDALNQGTTGFSDYNQAGQQDASGFSSGTAKEMADRILKYYDQGKYRDDNGSQIKQWRKVSAGSKLHNQCGGEVSMSPAVCQILLTLLDEGWMVGTYALVEDHHCNDGQHPKGEAVDISSLGKSDVGWRSLNTRENITTQWVKDLMVRLRDFNPDQIICEGVGGYDPNVAKLQWNHGSVVSHITTDHTNHMHIGISTSDINHRD